MKYNEKKANKGITLIALVITIIVLLILAGISIATLTGENGILSKANTATEESKKAEIKERLELAILDIQTEEIEKGNIFTMDSIIEKLPSKVKNTTISANGNLAQGNSEGYNYYIDEQYRVTLGEIEKKEYIEDGLIVLYDGENNTGSGHDNNTKTWTNIAKQTKRENDGTLKNINFDDKSGWTNNALVFDGIDDWVAIKGLNSPNITLEIVMEINEHPGTQEVCYMDNYEKGGYGIATAPYTPYNNFQININNEYESCSSKKEIGIGQIYSLSGSYDQKRLVFSENGEITTLEKQGSITYPDENTIMALGANPKGTEAKSAYLNGKIYSIRIYNRALTEEELQHNYQIDKERFHIIDETANDKQYVEDGMILHYDGLNKYGMICENKQIWKDLSGNNNDGTINGATLEKDCLVFDGINDWVAIKELNYSKITIEAVMEYITSTGNDEKAIVSNLEKGGYSLLRTPGQCNRFQVYINDQYYNVSSPNKMETNYKYSLSGNYDGKVLTLSENGQITTVAKEGSIKYPDSNTILTLGTNPKGTAPQSSFLNGRIYSVRIYNRALTKEEIQNNYEKDKERFGL